MPAAKGKKPSSSRFRGALSFVANRPAKADSSIREQRGVGGAYRASAAQGQTQPADAAALCAESRSVRSISQGKQVRRLSLVGISPYDAIFPIGSWTFAYAVRRGCVTPPSLPLTCAGAQPGMIFKRTTLLGCLAAHLSPVPSRPLPSAPAGSVDTVNDQSA